jgi:hypothetical protein
MRWTGFLAVALRHPGSESTQAIASDATRPPHRIVPCGGPQFFPGRIAAGTNDIFFSRVQFKTSKDRRELPEHFG